MRCEPLTALWQPQVDTVKKFGAGSNKVTGVGKDAAKLDRETEELHHDRHVSTCSRLTTVVI